MNDEKIWENVANKVSGEANEADEQAFQEWIVTDSENRKIFDRLLQIWQYNPKQIHDNSAIYRKYLHRKHQFGNRKTAKPLVYYALRISAVLFFLVTTTFLVNSILTSSDKKIAYQEINVPKGSRSHFNLPDGTKVWLSNNSSIKYPSEFRGDFRELEMKGEAYFDVTHNVKKPFIVNIGDNRIKVLGTQFSVTAYPDDKLVRADLVKGKIQFEIKNEKGGFDSYILKPSHSLVLDRTSGKLFESRVPDGFYDYWQKGIYRFRNETLEDLAVKIDRIYNTQIVFENENLKTKRFSGTISIDDNIFTFIEAVKSTSVEPIEYRYKERKLYINFKK
ncbi:FecR family protein [Maribellus maritimus]|uniref:FecR family protein n=1 Tax=Maribellus maritimus TaxID=2870838 RepID=UPI001EEB6757|nr:FecR domain-containing protein [Maribellus maritimus]MCG6189384.1 FecR domain-containing protein [Maribellus maritimus]